MDTLCVDQTWHLKIHPPKNKSGKIGKSSWGDYQWLRFGKVMLQSCLITGWYPNYWPEAAFAGETDDNLGENQSRMHFWLLRPCEVVGIPIPNSSNLVLACANHVCMSQTSSKSSFRVGGALLTIWGHTHVKMSCAWLRSVVILKPQTTRFRVMNIISYVIQNSVGVTICVQIVNQQHCHQRSPIFRQPTYPLVN